MASIATNSSILSQEPVQGFVLRLRGLLADWQLYRRTLSELQALNARALADLGTSRHEIAAIARDSVYGK